MRETLGLAFVSGLTFLVVYLKNTGWTLLRESERVQLDLPADTPLEEVIRVVERGLR